MPTKADEKPSTPKSSALTLLGQDHREVEAYFEEYETVRGEAKEAVALKICLALQVHAQIEEEIFYPAIRNVIGNRELLDEAMWSTPRPSS
jgi:hemerythrin superfamily protein